MLFSPATQTSHSRPVLSHPAFTPRLRFTPRIQFTLRIHTPYSHLKAASKRCQRRRKPPSGPAPCEGDPSTYTPLSPPGQGRDGAGTCAVHAGPDGSRASVRRSLRAISPCTRSLTCHHRKHKEGATSDAAMCNRRVHLTWSVRAYAIKLHQSAQSPYHPKAQRASRRPRRPPSSGA